MKTLRDVLDAAERHGRPAEITDDTGRAIIRYGERGSSIRIR